MDRFTELANADLALRNAESQLGTLRSITEIIQKEINSLTMLESQLEDNLICLRQRKIVAVANEFKKAREDLVKTRNRLAFLRIDRENQRKAIEKAEDIVVKARQTYNDLLKKPENNVVQGNFGRKDDGQD